MKVKMCDHIDVSGIRIEASESVFAICTVDDNQFVTYSCKKCYSEIKELKHEIISKEEFEKYLS
jgi:predicted nucleic-acid-binding Zn-ribbon protein